MVDQSVDNEWLNYTTVINNNTNNNKSIESH